MRITTRVVWSIETGTVLEQDWFEYSGPVALAKHGAEKRRADQQMQQQNAMQQKAFDTQMKTLSDLKSSFGKYLSGSGEGFDPMQLALLKTQFMGQNANDFNSARSGLISALASRGEGTGTGPVGGDYTRGLSGLYGAEAQSMAGGINNIGLSNLQQALTNKFNSGSILSGNAATLNSPISSFGAGASDALNQRIGIGMKPGFFGQMGNALAGGLGAGLGAGITGGIGGLMAGGNGFSAGFQSGAAG